ncbi:MAG: ABC transporter permease [Ignavibacteriales bacterium]|nr:ABC transporter permease [Ignavibacteriales bacterium]
MLNKRILTLIKREVKAKMMTKGFIISIILVPILFIALMSLPTLLMSYEREGLVKMEIISDSEEITSGLERVFVDDNYISDTTLSFSFQTMSRESFEMHIKETKQKILDEKLTAVIFIPSAALQNKVVEYYSLTPNTILKESNLRSMINKVLTGLYLDEKNLTEEEVMFVQSYVGIKGFLVSKEEEVSEAGYGNTILSYVFSLMLYIGLLMMGQFLLQSVIEEKSSRIVEVILSSVTSTELMTAKIIGYAFTGLVQMFIWTLPLILLASSTLFALPPEIMVSINISQIFYFLLNFLFGLLIFMGLFAAVGATCDNPQDAQSAIWPVMILIIIPFFISMALMKDPLNPIAQVASLLPFASVIVMPARLAIIDVPVWQIILSIAVNIATLLLIFPLAGKIYKIGILRTGKKASFKEMLKWIRVK